MTQYNYTYESCLRTIFGRGIDKGDRTGTGTRSLFGQQMRFDLTQGFPLITTKKVFMKAIVHELIWFLKGATNIKYLVDNGVHIWDDWADEKGDLGPVYGAQWRSWPSFYEITSKWSNGFGYYNPTEGIDQIANVVARIKAKPDDRRLIVSAWNPAEIDKMKLPPCHCLFQFYTRPMTVEQRYDEWVKSGSRTKIPGWQDKTGMVKFFDDEGIPSRYLDCQLYQRSADFFLGVPFNIASYALLTHMIAQQVNMVAGEFVWTGGDCHIYSNHFDQVALQLSRTGFPYPQLKLNKAASIFDYKFEDIEIVGYESQPTIAAPIAV